MKFRHLLFVLLFAGCAGFPVALFEPADTFKGPVPERVVQLRAEWKKALPVFKGSTFTVQPSVRSPYAPGALDPRFLDDGLRAIRFVRLLSGVPLDVEIDPALSVQAQHGAVLLAGSGQFGHHPTRPRDMDQGFYDRGNASTGSSNIYMSYGGGFSLLSVVATFMEDSDAGNIDRLGHRRWILNPSLRKTAFGCAMSDNGSWYVTLQVFDSSGDRNFAYDHIDWPASGYHPVSLFGGVHAWSASLNPAMYDAARTRDIIVKLVRERDRRTWTFDARDKNKTGKYFNVELVGYGVPFCVIFRPDGVYAYEAGDRFTVEIGGVYRKGSGEAATIGYSVEFFRL